MTRIKLCGFSREEDVSFALGLGVDFIGVRPPFLRRLIGLAPRQIVGVFVDEPLASVESYLLDGLNLAQFHGAESFQMIDALPRSLTSWKAIRVRPEWSAEDVARHASDFASVDAILLDTFSAELPGSTGQRFDHEVAVRIASERNVVLAGGLTPENVRDAILLVQPYAVDVATGIESAPGVKDYEKMRRFVDVVRDADEN